MISRQEALNLLHQSSSDQALLNHALETEAIMRQLARHLGQDSELWGITGLLHDLDYPQTKDSPQQHGLLSVQQLQEKVDPQALQAIKAHNSEMNGTLPQSTLDFALRCSESTTGLISANALVRPQGMAGMKAKSLRKKMKDKSFAANVSRDRVMECQKIGLDLDAFFELAISAVTEIADQVGLDR